MPTPFRRTCAGAALLMLGVSTTPQAATLTYTLDQSNLMPDGIGYLQVIVSDGMEGAIDFTVRVLDPLLDLAGDGFGIQRFSFNLIPGGGAEAVDVTGLPDGWRAKNGGRLDGFGVFDISLMGNGASRVGELTFSITGVTGDSLLDYVSLSSGHVADGHAWFAAKVYGMDLRDAALGNSGRQAAFGTPGATAVVPAPAAFWLLVSGVGLLAGVARGRRQPRSICA